MVQAGHDVTARAPGRHPKIAAALALRSACHQPAPIEHAGLNPVLDAWSTVSLTGRRETVAPGVRGFLVLVGAAPALALAIERLVLKPELVLATGAGRRAPAAQQYDARRINAVMLQARGLA